MIEVRPAEAEDSTFARRTLEENWGGPPIAVHGELIDASVLPALVAWSVGERAGLLTYREGDARGWEIVTLDAVVCGAGAGGALIDALRALAASRGARRLWLVTTNDNTFALRFYQRRGFDLAAVHRDAVTASAA
jgi:ribosomal protein S18 acetylase RimI-like enzyme